MEVSSMPYIITTTTRKAVTCDTNVSGGRTSYWPVTSRRAVATLDEARSDVRAIALDHDSIGGAQKAMRLPEPGGTVGPLPGGTVIEVTQVSLSRLAELGGIKPRQQSGQWKLTSIIVAAYNKAR